MFELDDKFFEEIGISNMPPAELASFKEHIKEEVDIRVGERISDGVSIDKLAEFEKIIDGDKQFATQWVENNFPQYQQDQVYAQIAAAYGGQSENLIVDYASAKWLQINRPDFAAIVESVAAEMKAELKANASRISGL